MFDPKLLGAGLIFNSILLGTVAIAQMALGDIPIRDPWFLLAVWLMFYYNHLRSVVKGMPAPTPDSTEWYRWTYSAVHTLFRQEEKTDPQSHRKDMIETIELVQKLTEKSGGKNQ